MKITTRVWYSCLIFIFTSIPLLTHASSSNKNPPVTPPEGECKCPDLKTYDMNSSNSPVGTTGASTSSQGNGGPNVSMSFGNFDATGMPSGNLNMKTAFLDEESFTPAALSYRHLSQWTAQIIYKFPNQATPLTIDPIDWIRTTITSDEGYDYVDNASTGVWTPEGQGSDCTLRCIRLLDSNMNLVRDDPAYIEERHADQTRLFYTLQNGVWRVKKIITSTGVEVEMGPMLHEVIYANGNISQIFNKIDGLMDVVILSDISYRINWYKPSDINGKSDGRYQFTGTPVKSWTFTKTSNNPQKIRLTESRPGISFVYEWTNYPQSNRWELTKGSGADAVTEIKEVTENQTEKTVVESTKDHTGRIVFQQQSIYSKTDNGDLLVREILDPTGISWMTTYEYNSKGLRTAAHYPNGYSTSWTYDGSSRTLTESSSTVYGTETKHYAYNSDDPYDYQPHTLRVTLNGAEVSNTTYEHLGNEQAGRINTVTETRGNVARVNRQEYYGNDAGTVAAGKIKRNVNPQGTEEYYEYVVTANGYKAIKTIQANGNIVPHLSTRVIQFFVNGDITRTENYAHDGSAFQLLSFTDYTHSPSHYVVREDYSTGRFSTFQWICVGPTEKVDEWGIKTEYFYNTAKRLYKTIRYSPHGLQTTTYGLDAMGRQTSETFSSEGVTRTTSSEYDTLGRVTRTIAADGRPTTTSYSSNGNITTQTFSSGGIEIQVAHPNGTLLSVSGTATIPQYYTYSFSNGQQIVRKSIGSANSARQEVRYYDLWGQLVREAKSGAPEITYTYDSKGRRLTATPKAYGWKSEYEHDAFGNQVKETKRSIDLNSNVISSTVVGYYPLGQDDATVWQTTVTNTSSDPAILSTTAIKKQRVSSLINALNSWASVSDVRGNEAITYTSYNPSDKKLTTVQKIPGKTNNATSIAIDGRTMESSDGTVSKHFTYDGLGRIISTVGERGLTSSTTYNSKHEMVAFTNENGIVHEYGYDPASGQMITTKVQEKTDYYVNDLRGLPVASCGESSYPIQWEYNIYGQKTKTYTYRGASYTTTLPAKNLCDVTEEIYDEFSGRLTVRRNPDGTMTSFLYDKGKLVSRLSARGIMTEYSYNDVGLLTDITYSDGTSPIHCEYDKLGRLSSVYDAKGMSTFEYNAYGERISENIDGYYYQKLLTHHYDSLGRDVGYSVDGDRKTTYLYGNNDGRISGMDVGDVKNFVFGRLPNSDLINTITYPNDMVKTTAYEPNRNMITSVSLDRNGTNISRYNYANDSLGRRISMARSYEGSDDEFQYDYNDRGELTSAQNPDLDASYVYNYDNIGNRKTASEAFDFEGVYQYGPASNATQYSTNANNQYTSLTDTVSSATKAITFDADGNQTVIHTSLGSWDVEYDAENRPVSFSTSSWGGSVTMSYDFMGRRFMKCSLGAPGPDQWSSREFFSYNNYLQIERFNDYDVINSTVWDPTDLKNSKPLGIKWPGESYMSDYNVYHYISHDANKNVTDAVKSDGTISSHYEYTPYGELLRADEWSITELCMFRFSSEYYEPELGLYYYNFRHYNPTDGRWLSRDPIGVLGGFNLYGFTLNEPIGQTDRLGLITWPWEDPINTDEAGNCPKAAKTMKEISKDVTDVRTGTWPFRSLSCRTTITKYSFTLPYSNGRKPESNRCGPGSPWIINQLVPDGFAFYDDNGVRIFVPFEPACHNHDICYMTCTGSQETCDNDFLRDIKNICSSAGLSGIALLQCNSLAYIYYAAVSSLGGWSYEEAQEEFCLKGECSSCTAEQYAP